MTQKYSAQTIAFGAVDKVTRQIVVDDSTGERANLSYDKATGSILVEDTVDPDSVNPVSGRAVAEAVAGASGEVPIIGSGDNGKVLTAVVDGESKSVEWADAPTGVPSTQASDNGKVLGVTDTSGTLGWVNQPVSNVTTADKKFNVSVNGTGYPVEISYNATLGSIPGSKDLAAKNYDTSDYGMIAVVLKAWDYAQDGGLSVGNVAKLVIPESGLFGVYAEYLRIDYFNSANGHYGSTIFLGGEDTGSGWPAYMHESGYVAGTYDLPVVSTAAGDQACDSVGIFLRLSDIDASPADIAAAKAHMEEVMAGWTIQWPTNSSGYNIAIPDIPAVTSADNNKVLTASWDSGTSTGSFGWAAAGGGGGGGSASISDIVRDIDASNPQAGQTDSAFFNGLVSDIQAGKIVRLVASQMNGDTYTEYAFLDRYYLDGNDSAFYFFSHRYSYLMTWDDGWSLSRGSNT